eukprot:c11506_g1_i3.p1 GENE.c11506_g1_i3~~c11506_g1_i3.p1  ORF type:complete len:632 (+),score=147.33 c11506_g1_i3:45-1898(+)
MESNPLRIFLAGEQGAEDNIKFFKELVGDKEFPEQGSRESVRESNWTDKRSVQLVRIPEYSQHATEAAIRSLIEEVRVDVQTIILEGQLRKYKLQTEQQKSPLVGPPPKEDIVNICFYLVAPNRFKHLDIMFIKALSKRVTVVVLVNGISSKTDPEICASIAKRLELDEVITFQLCNPEQPPSLLVPEKKSDTRLLPHVFLLTDEAQAKFPSLTPSDISKAFLNLSPQKIEDFLKKANEQLDKAHATRISPFTKAQKRERVTKVTIGKRNVDVFTNLVTIKPETLEKLTTFSAFTNWIQRIANDPTVLIESIRVKSLDVFTSKNGFVEIEVFYTIEGDPKQRREEIFLRGGAISILIVLNCEGEEYTLVTKTARTPTGRDYLVEIPAGMIQDDGSVGGANFKVIINKTGLEMKQNELINLTAEAFGEEYSGIIAIPEASDEEIALYLCCVDVQCTEDLKELMARAASTEQEQSKPELDRTPAAKPDRVKLEVVPLATLWQDAPDAKALSALAIYHSLRESGRLAKHSNRKAKYMPKSQVQYNISTPVSTSNNNNESPSDDTLRRTPSKLKFEDTAKEWDGGSQVQHKTSQSGFTAAGDGGSGGGVAKSSRVSGSPVD